MAQTEDWPIGGGRRMPISRARELVSDYAYTEATIENMKRNAVAAWRAPFPDDHGTVAMLKRIGDLLCLGIEIELMEKDRK